MRRRGFLQILSSVPVLALAPMPGARDPRSAADIGGSPFLVLIELKGGNDGFNTVVPYRDPAYYALRPTLAIGRDHVIPLTDRAGLHPALTPLLPLWQAGELAVLDGVGYPGPQVSHFRAIDIWDTASRSDQYLEQGWLARAFATTVRDTRFAADAVFTGSAERGPLAGDHCRVVALTANDPALGQGQFDASRKAPTKAALAQIPPSEAGIELLGLSGLRAFATDFPCGILGSGLRSAASIAAHPFIAPITRITHSGFDTHGGQLETQACLLSELATGLVALKAALVEIGRWNETLIVTYAEFGRQAQENLAGGTDHGTSSAHFALGGRVAGGLYGEAPALDRLDGAGNATYAIDFRAIYATVLDRFLGIPSIAVLNDRYGALPILRA